MRIRFAEVELPRDLRPAVAAHDSAEAQRFEECRRAYRGARGALFALAHGFGPMLEQTRRR